MFVCPGLCVGVQHAAWGMGCGSDMYSAARTDGSTAAYGRTRWWCGTRMQRAVRLSVSGSIKIGGENGQSVKFVGIRLVGLDV